MISKNKPRLWLLLYFFLFSLLYLTTAYISSCFAVKYTAIGVDTEGMCGVSELSVTIPMLIAVIFLPVYLSLKKVKKYNVVRCALHSFPFTILGYFAMAFIFDAQNVVSFGVPVFFLFSIVVSVISAPFVILALCAAEIFLPKLKPFLGKIQ